MRLDRDMDRGSSSWRTRHRRGTLDDPNWVKPKVHGWTRSALHWMVFPPDVEIFKTTALNKLGYQSSAGLNVVLTDRQQPPERTAGRRLVLLETDGTLAG